MRLDPYCARGALLATLLARVWRQTAAIRTRLRARSIWLSSSTDCLATHLIGNQLWMRCIASLGVRPRRCWSILQKLIQGRGASRRGGVGRSAVFPGQQWDWSGGCGCENIAVFPCVCLISSTARSSDTCCRDFWKCGNLVFTGLLSCAHRSMAGIDVCGQRVADEILQIASEHPSLEHLSLVGLSLGGIICRYKLYPSSANECFDYCVQTYAWLQWRYAHQA